jgi:hypothetical protein
VRLRFEISKFALLVLLSIAIVSNTLGQDISTKEAGISVTVAQQLKLSPKKVRLTLPIKVETRKSDTILKTLQNHS